MRLGTVTRRPVGIAALFLAFAAVACVEERNAPAAGGSSDQEVVRIGLIAPFSGTAASIGRNMREGVTIAVDELNAAGGVLGRQIEVVARDNQFEPSRTSQIAREMIDQDGVSLIIGPPGTTSYLAIDDLVRQEGMVTMPIVTGPQLEENLNDYTFRIMIPDDIQVDVLVDYALEQGLDRVAIIAEDNETGGAIADLAEARLQERGSRSVSTVLFSEDELDLTPVVLKAQQADADAVIIGSHIGPYAARLATAADSLGYDPQFLGLAGLTSYTYPDLAREAAEGTIFVAPPVPVLAGEENLSPTAEAFYDEYVDRYFGDGTTSKSGADKVTGAAYLTYDGVKMWAAAAEDAGSADPQAVADVFNSGFEYGPDESSAGVVWSYDAQDHEGFHEGDTWFYEWARSGNDMTFRFLGEAHELVGA
jgi:branched-chain amino acid transport system substrate-binding protein